MNKRFLRLVLFVMHRTEKQSLFGLNYSTWAEPVIRWNGLMCSVVFSMVFLAVLFHESVQVPFLSKIGLGGMVLFFWFICVNAWFFHRMRRKRLFRKAKQRTRWMLNAAPYCFVGNILVFVLLFVPTWSPGDPYNQLFPRIVLAFVFPLFLTYAWIVVATTPFHLGYSKRSNQERQP